MCDLFAFLFWDLCSSFLGDFPHLSLCTVVLDVIGHDDSKRFVSCVIGATNESSRSSSDHVSPRIYDICIHASIRFVCLGPPLIGGGGFKVEDVHEKTMHVKLISICWGSRYFIIHF